MSAVNRFIDRFKHEAKPKIAVDIPRPCVGTTSQLRWREWQDKYPDAKFQYYNGLYIMFDNPNN